MATTKTEATARVLLDRCGETYAAQAGIRLRDTPASLYQLLVLSHLLSARIRADTAVAAARTLFDAGMKDPKRMVKATWQQRVDALGVAHYRRYDERTATQLGEAAQMVLERYGGDLRKLRGAHATTARLQEIPGIGPVGAEIFLREVQAVWPEYAPHIDVKVRQGAERVGLPRSPEALAGLVAREDVPRLTAGLVRVSLDQKLANEVRERAAAAA